MALLPADAGRDESSDMRIEIAGSADLPAVERARIVVEMDVSRATVAEMSEVPEYMETLRGDSTIHHLDFGPMAVTYRTASPSARDAGATLPAAQGDSAGAALQLQQMQTVFDISRLSERAQVGVEDRDMIDVALDVFANEAKSRSPRSPVRLGVPRPSAEMAVATTVEPLAMAAVLRPAPARQLFEDEGVLSQRARSQGARARLEKSSDDARQQVPVGPELGVSHAQPGASDSAPGN